MDLGTAVDTVVAYVLKQEGGVSNVGDGMGVTRYGQTDAWLQQYGLPVPTSQADAARNYRIWLTMTQLVRVVQKDVTLGTVVVDTAVHSGVSQAVKLLQRALGVKDDGIFGPQTITAMELANAAPIAVAVVSGRARLVGAILQATPADVRYAHDWLNRLGDSIALLGA